MIARSGAIHAQLVQGSVVPECRDGAHRPPVDESIIEAYVQRLKQEAPRLGGEDDLLAQVRHRGEVILHATHARLDTGLERACRLPTPDIGAARAHEGIQPSESLHAAHILFEEAIPRLTAHYRASAASRSPEQVAIALHGAISELIVTAASSYVGVLLERISRANVEARLRVARDLHDHTAHGVGAGMLGIDLALHLLASGRTPDAQQLLTTRETLADTLDDVRDMATQLRDCVGERGLRQALLDHVAMVAPSGVGVSVTMEGDLDHLPHHVEEESYLVLREAISNALAHGRGRSSVQVTVCVDGAALRASVVDDGAGFDPCAADRVRHGGLSSMRERAEGVGGVFALESAVGAGTRVSLHVPLPRSPR